MAVINEACVDVSYTRIIEHKHFNNRFNLKHTIITREYPQKWERGLEPYYSINVKTNNALYEKYYTLVREIYPTIKLGGRLGDYKYYDMDDVIAKALDVLI